MESQDDKYLKISVHSTQKIKNQTILNYEGFHILRFLEPAVSTTLLKNEKVPQSKL